MFLQADSDEKPDESTRFWPHVKIILDKVQPDRQSPFFDF